jgi:iron complex transport system substrate-binding protein
VPAVAQGRVFLAPSLPYGFIDAPPSLNRFAGLIWLLHTLYPDRIDGNLRDDIRTFYKTFYQVEPNERELTTLLSDAGG